MSDKTGIEWTDATWNPIVGCSIVSPGCTNCYAMRMAARIDAMREGDISKAGLRARQGAPPSHYAGTTQASKAGPVWTGKIAQAPDHILTAPLRWRKPRRIFVNSMGDLFHESIPDKWIDRVFAVMALAPQHIFQCLTKRSKRMREYCSTIQQNGRWLEMEDYAFDFGRQLRGNDAYAFDWISNNQFLPNVWLGVSAEDQKRADERIPDLLATPAAKRFVSAEPLLAPIHFKMTLGEDWLASGRSGEPKGLDWVILGGESGSGARPMHPTWARSIRDQCKAANIAFFFKQWGEWARHKPEPGGDLSGDVRAGRVTIVHPSGRDSVEIMRETKTRQSETGSLYMARVGKRRAGSLLDGVEHKEWPR